MSPSPASTPWRRSPPPYDERVRSVTAVRTVLAGSVPNVVQCFTLYVYATFAIAFLTRPIGSWVFGRYARRQTRVEHREVAA